VNRLPEPLRRAWEIVTSDEYSTGARTVSDLWIFRPPPWLADGRLNPTFRKELLGQLRPYLHLKSRSKLLLGEPEGETSDLGEITQYVSVEVRLYCRDRAQSLIEGINKDAKKADLLADIADDVTSLLKDAMDLFATAGRADEIQDPSQYDYPSIDPHPQDHHFQEWSYLIDLVRDSFDALKSIDTDAADTLLGRWRTMKFPVFRRLILHELTP
jgi:hypothetical protein